MGKWNIRLTEIFVHWYVTRSSHKDGQRKSSVVHIVLLATRKSHSIPSIYGCVMRAITRPTTTDNKQRWADWWMMAPFSFPSPKPILTHLRKHVGVICRKCFASGIHTIIYLWLIYWWTDNFHFYKLPRSRCLVFMFIAPLVRQTNLF